jgi:regulator of PEP synthase PpsR (kinase-PPPase family)
VSRNNHATHPFFFHRLECSIIARAQADGVFVGRFCILRAENTMKYLRTIQEKRCMMTDGTEKLVEIMSLMLDEQRETKKVMREMNDKLGILNDRMGAVEYALTHDSREFRQRLERVESRIAKLEERH